MADPKDVQEHLAELMDLWERERYVEEETRVEDNYHGWVRVTHLRRQLMAKENCP